MTTEFEALADSAPRTVNRNPPHCLASFIQISSDRQMGVRPSIEAEPD
jgi:hypothetical protein